MHSAIVESNVQSLYGYNMKKNQTISLFKRSHSSWTYLMYVCGGFEKGFVEIFVFIIIFWLSYAFVVIASRLESAADCRAAVRQTNFTIFRVVGSVYSYAHASADDEDPFNSRFLLSP